MRVWLTMVALGFSLPLTSSGAVANQEEKEDREIVMLVMDFRGDWEPVSYEQFQRETQRLLSPIGIQLQWRLYSGGLVAPVERLIIVRLFGHFGGEEDSREAREPGPLGTCRRTDGKVQPFIRIHCDRIRGVIDSRLTGKDGRTRNLAFGRAAARVLAHELYHVLTQSGDHTRTGIAKGGLSPQDLVKHSLGFDREALRRLREQPREAVGR